ncbi:transposase [Williamsia herbipolensis]|uniref:transposase n=1 Tax=Williamsia herbipolensis TaxID=1603258 RepID=UPI000695F70E|nr:transposase [Williamsia herbipolensis]
MESSVYTPGAGHLPPVLAGRDDLLHAMTVRLNDVASVGLVAWLRLLALHQLPQLRSCAPKALRYRLLHTPAHLVHTARKRLMRLPDTWPWTADIISAWTDVTTLTPP